METQEQKIMDALESFFKDDSEKVVEYMESMLYDWYQHYAQDNYQIEHINEVVNGAFRINDLILKLYDIMLSTKEEQGLIDYSIAG